MIARPVRVLADFLRGPVARLAKFAFGVVDVVGEQTMGRAADFARIKDVCGNVERPQPCAQRRHQLSVAQIRLGQNQPVGHRYLFGRLGKAADLGRAVDGVNRGDDAGETEMVAQDGLGQQRVGDRRRIRQSGSLDDDPAEIRHLAARSPRQLLAQRLLQIAAHRAAQAAVFQQQRAFGDALQQMMVEPDLAELVDEDENVGQLRRAQQTLQQRGFAAAEKAGDDVDRA